MSAFFRQQQVPYELVRLEPGFSAGVAWRGPSRGENGLGQLPGHSAFGVGIATLYGGDKDTAAPGPIASFGDRHLARLARAASSDSQLAHLSGDFAAAVLDPDAHSLVLLRDHTGTWPLHYSQYGSACAFSDVVRPLLAVPWASSELDEIALAAYLSVMSSGRGRTYWRSVKSLPAASAVRLSGSEPATPCRYWMPAPARGVVAKTPTEAYEAVREQMVRAVVERLEDTSCPAFWLSGGLDSSTVVGIACSQFPERSFHASSSASPEGFIGHIRDERDYVRLMAERYPNLRVDYEVGGQEDLLPGVEGFATWGAGPVDDAFFDTSLGLFNLSLKAGATTILTGDGGDFCVSMRAKSIGVADAIWTLRPGLLASEMERLQRSGESRLGVIRSCVIPALVPEPLRRAWHVLTPGRHATSSVLQGAVSKRPEVAHHLRECGVGYQPRVRSMRDHERERVIAVDTCEQTSSWVLCWTASRQIDFRNPLFDPRLIETCMALPPELKVGRELDRMVIRRAAAPYLPQQIARRPDKGAFSPDYAARWQAALPRIRETISKARGNERFRELVDLEAVESGLDNLQAEGGRGAIAGPLHTVIAPYLLARFLESPGGS